MNIKVKKTDKYKIGQNSITDLVGKERKLAFDRGETIEVNEQELQYLIYFGFAEVTEE